LTSEIQKNNRYALDEVHSFVLRICVDRSQRGNRRYRLRYQLENVNESSSRRFRNLDELLDQLRGEVKTICSDQEMLEQG
jgi:hypothetical protein